MHRSCTEKKGNKTEEFRRGTLGMACLYTMLCRASPGKLSGQGPESSVGSFTYPSGGRSWLSYGGRPVTRLSPSLLEGGSKTCSVIPLVKAVSEVCLRSTEGTMDPTCDGGLSLPHCRKGSSVDFLLLL